MPPIHPFNPIPALRLCTAAGADIEDTRAVFDLIYGKGIQPDNPEGIQLIGEALNISNPERAIQDPVVKNTFMQIQLKPQAMACLVFQVL